MWIQKVLKVSTIAIKSEYQKIQKPEKCENLREEKMWRVVKNLNLCAWKEFSKRTARNSCTNKCNYKIPIKVWRRTRKVLYDVQDKFLFNYWVSFGLMIVLLAGALIARSITFISFRLKCESQVSNTNKKLNEIFSLEDYLRGDFKIIPISLKLQFVGQMFVCRWYFEMLKCQNNYFIKEQWAKLIK